MKMVTTLSSGSPKIILYFSCVKIGLTINVRCKGEMWLGKACDAQIFT